VVTFDKSLLKGEAQRFSADFSHPLSCQRPFNFPRQLSWVLRIDSIIAMSDINTVFITPHFNLHGHRNGHGNGNGHGNINRPGNGNGHGNGNGNGNGN
jgi:hypothetical protein